MNSQSPALKVLVAEDHAPSSTIMCRMLEHYGYDVVVARDGEQAIEKYRSEKPQLVLMDVLMPRMNGYEAVRQIKEIAGDDFVPVIFVTAIHDEDALAKCVEVGGDAFLTKPYSHTVLKSKIDAMLRIRSLHDRVVVQNRAISHFQDQLLNEQRVAEKVFHTIVRSGRSGEQGVRCVNSAKSIFNGDLFLTAKRATGELHFLIADFTGHGLSAAIGALPVSDIFQSMTSNGCSVADIAEVMNAKLKRILPGDMFCAACIGSVDAIERRLTLWNGGLPPVFIVDGNNRIRERLPPAHLALGILDEQKFDRSVQVFALEPRDRIFACTDGLIDAPIATGGRFTQDGYEACFEAPVPSNMQFDWIIDSVREIGEGNQNDDLTLIEIDTNLDESVSVAKTAAASRVPSTWETSLRIDMPALQAFDPVPHFLRLLSEIQGLDSHKANLVTILTEMYVHALDGVLLGMNPELRADHAGAPRYFEERTAKLRALERGSIYFSLRHRVEGCGGELIIQVASSGGEKNFNQVPLSGRRLPLLRTLCDCVYVMGSGNCVEATYRWGVSH